MLIKLTVATTLLIAFPVFGQVRPATSLKVQTSTDANVFVRSFCKLGLQFIATSLSKESNGNGSGGLAVIQVIGRDGKPMPCEEDSK
jgi:hypothetical protein